MDRPPRDHNRPNIPKIAESPKVDQGVSSAPDRRCNTCACYLEIPNSTGKGPGQGVCRRNGVLMMQTQNRITGQMEMNLTFAPTMAELVCFDGWRPENTAPGDNWNQTRLTSAFVPVMMAALKQAGVSSKLSEDIGRAMMNSVVAAASLDLPPSKA